ncbi:hypothetical protein L7F22_043729 [Adiantum nelumboides]|nr:hypothetical protein [Adiantum nelumboides]
MTSRSTTNTTGATDIFDEKPGESSTQIGIGEDGSQNAGDTLEQRDPGLDEDEEEEEEDEAMGGRGGEAGMLGEEFASQQLEHDIYESESPSESGTDSLTWISWFCSLPGHEYFAEVSEDFIEDDFNLTGLNALVPFYKEALEMILDVEPQEDSLKIPDVSIVESSAELLYGLIHQRYILTRQGLQQMADKYERGHFGFCPRVFCHSHPVLPCGRSDLPGLDTVKLFCANCVDNYSPPSSRFHGVDGAFFGTTFPHLLFQTYRELAPSPIAPAGTNFASLNTQTQQQGSISQRSNGAVQSGKGDTGTDGNTTTESSSNAGTTAVATSASTLTPEVLGQRNPQARLYTPRIYGFRVSEYAKSGPRMRWMRMRPESFDELDRCVVRTELYPSAGGQTTNSGGIGLNSSSTGTGTVGTGTTSGMNANANTEADGANQTTSQLQHGIDASGRSTATGRPMAGRVPSTQTVHPTVEAEAT